MSDLGVLRAAAEISEAGGYGVWAYDTWDSYNRSFFDGALRPGGIFWGLTPHGHSLGYYEHWRNCITLHVSLLTPKSNAWGIYQLLGKRYASDVLLHEMVHQVVWLRDGYVRGGAGESCHNNEHWVGEIMRLSPLLGLECRAKVVKQRRVGGKPRWVPDEGFMTRREIASWPHSLRMPGYYEYDPLARRNQSAGESSS